MLVDMAKVELEVVTVLQQSIKVYHLIELTDWKVKKGTQNAAGADGRSPRKMTIVRGFEWAVLRTRSFRYHGLHIYVAS